MECPECGEDDEMIYCLALKEEVCDYCCQDACEKEWENQMKEDF